MGKYYYNGVLLPEIPADVLASYPYVWVKKSSGNNQWYFYAGKEKWWLRDSTYLVYDSEIVIYTIPQDDWEYVNKVSNGYFNVTGTPPCWANHDIPNGSATSTAIYYYASEPVPYPDLVFEDYAIKRESLTAIGDAIRAKTGEEGLLSLAEMVEAIGTIDGIPVALPSVEGGLF